MSRSRRKPYITDQQRNQQGTRWAKRCASRAVRQLSEDTAPADGKAYRKLFNPWKIRDWSFHSKDPKATRK